MNVSSPLSEHPTRVQGIRSSRLPWRFDIASALHEAQQLPHTLWRTHFNQTYHDGGWQALALREAPQATLDILPVDADVSAYIDSPALAQCPHIAGMLQTMDLPWKSVRLMQLLPGCEIREHTDAGVCAAQGEVRLHIPLQTDSAVFFHIDGQRIPMRAGECWYTDVSQPHRVRSRSTQSRIHLVADAVVNPRLVDALLASDSGDPMAPGDDPWQRFQRFQDAVFRTPAWADELAACTDLADLIARTVQLGHAQGYAFEASDVESSFRAGRKAWIAQWTL